MPMPHDGLAKLIEECAEVQQIAAIMLVNPGRDTAPGRGEIVSLRAELQDEIADIAAASRYVIDKLGLDEEYMRNRAEQKYARFKLWEKEQTAEQVSMAL